METTVVNGSAPKATTRKMICSRRNVLTADMALPLRFKQLTATIQAAVVRAIGIERTGIPRREAS